MTRPDVVVIGGGIVGAATAHALQRQGVRRVTVVDGSAVAPGATSVSGGLVRTFDLDPEVCRLAAESFGFFTGFQQRVGRSCGFRRTGSLHVLPDAAREHARQIVVTLRSAGHVAELLDRPMATALFPAMRWAEPTCAVLEPDGGCADPVLTTRALLGSVASHGGRVLQPAWVSRVAVRGSRVTGVSTSVGTVEAPTVIVAAGAWSHGMLRDLGITIGLRTKRIEYALFERPPAEDALPAFVDDETGVWGRPHGEDAYLAGRVSDVWDVAMRVHRTLDPDTVADIRAQVAGRVPWLEQAPVLGGRRAFDAYTPDRRGILGRSADLDGLVLATGWSGQGFKLAPAVGVRAAALALGQPLAAASSF